MLDTEFLDDTEKGEKLARYQPHYQTITDDTQVQIYEELITNADCKFTTSFIHRVHHIKDNRLPARGWIDAATFAGYRDRPSHFKPREDYERPQIQPQGEVLFQFVKATEPEGASVVGEKHPPCDDSEFPPDEDYVLFPSDGADRVTYRIPWQRFGESQPAKVTVTLYSQSMTPFWLHQRFKLAKEAKDKGYATPQADRLHFLMSHLDLKGTKMEDYKLPLVTVSKPDKVP